MESSTGRLPHGADHRGPGAFAGQRVVVMGAGNPAVQVATELARTSRTAPAGRR
ncbi:hypothetical protein [Streptomyces sp. NPDC057438]|uniref:hypothetical protein n=1 Tax=Streptomyces sp. NPDC057438 TaxID=3346133 RepID=UPI00367B004A